MDKEEKLANNTGTEEADTTMVSILATLANLEFLETLATTLAAPVVAILATTLITTAMRESTNLSFASTGAKKNHTQDRCFAGIKDGVPCVIEKGDFFPKKLLKQTKLK